MANEYKVAVLISGRGSNLKSLIENAKHYRVIAVLSDNPDAIGLKIANNAGVQTFAYSRAQLGSAAQQKRAILEKLKELSPDLIALAGFMMIIGKDFLEAFPERIVNIHPSLLPKFPGLDTHQRALAAKEREHGCTVHMVDSGIDTGRIIAQSKVNVEIDDTAATLGERVLKREHVIYPWVLNAIASGEIEVSDRGIQYAAPAIAEAARLEIYPPTL